MAKLPLATIREVLNIVDSGGNVPEAMRCTQESLVGKIQPIVPWEKLRKKCKALPAITLRAIWMPRTKLG